MLLQLDAEGHGAQLRKNDTTLGTLRGNQRVKTERNDPL
jgi:hypothetical protein